MRRDRSPSGRPTYVFQHAHPSAHATTPWYLCSHMLHVCHRFHISFNTAGPELFSSASSLKIFACRAKHDTYVGRPETDRARQMAMNLLGRGLSAANQDEDALTIQEAELAMERRLGGSESDILTVQGNLAMLYQRLGRREEALQMKRDVYSGRLKLQGEGHESTLLAANNYAVSLRDLEHFGEAKSLMRKSIPVARRVFGDNHDFTLRMRRNYALVLYSDDGATPDDLREAVELLEDTARTARRVLGGAHPITPSIELALRCAQGKLRARETPTAPGSS